VAGSLYRVRGLKTDSGYFFLLLDRFKVANSNSHNCGHETRVNKGVLEEITVCPSGCVEEILWRRCGGPRGEKDRL